MGVLRGVDRNEKSELSLHDELSELGLSAGSLVVVKGELLVRWNDFADINVDPSDFYHMEFVGCDLKGSGVYLNHDGRPSLYDGDRPDYIVWGPLFLDALEQKLVVIEVGEGEDTE